MSQMKHPVIGMLVCGVVLSAASLRVGAYRSQAVASPPTADYQRATAAVGDMPQRALLRRYCFGCHNSRAKIGGLALDSLDLAHVGRDAQTWEKVVRKLRAGLMPPPGQPRPERAAYDALASWIEEEVDRAAAGAPDPGRVVAHRLNRTEYQNAIRDLLALEVDVSSLLPPDDADLGFDNMADILSISPTLVDRLLSTARKISRIAVGARVAPADETYSSPKTQYQDDRMSEDQPFGTRGGITVRHYFPLDGDYAIKVRLRPHPVRLCAWPRPAPAAGGSRGWGAGHGIHARR